jgi:hypothetical protein
MLFEIHASPTIGHSAFRKTYEWIKCYFFLGRHEGEICTCVVECDTFQCNKRETIKTPVTLQNLPIIPFIWIDISMEFIIGLPKSDNK